MPRSWTVIKGEKTKLKRERLKVEAKPRCPSGPVMGPAPDGAPRANQALRDWLVSGGMSVREFAKVAGIPYSTMIKIMQNIHLPGIGHAGRIQQATDGAVPMAWWIGGQTK